ncbi:MAG: AI-2E family transporter [Ktedonobacteraceae bacterium]
MDHATWQRRRDILICVICVGIVVWAGWNLLNQFVEAILMLLLAMAVAFLITPVVNYMEQEGKTPRLLATIVAYIVVLAFIAAFVYITVFSLTNQVAGFTSTISQFAANIPQNYGNFLDFLQKQAGIPAESIKTVTTQIQGQLSAFAQAAAYNAVSTVFLITNTFLDFLIVAVLSFYLTLDGKRIRSNILSIIPQNGMKHALLFEDALNRVVGNYIRGQLILAILVGVMVAIVCLITGLSQFALIFGVLGFLFETIPMIGPGLASVAPILASLLLPYPFPRTLIVIGCFVLIQALESNVLGPRIVGHAVGLHPVASIMALLVFAKLFGTAFGPFGGAVGALVATPLVAAAWVVIASLYHSARGETADQIMTRKRAPWTIRRPTIPTSLRLRRTPGSRLTGKETLPRVPAPLTAIAPTPEPAEQHIREQQGKNEVGVGQEADPQ